MLLEKSKFQDGEIITLKIMSGEEIVGKFVKEDLTDLTMSRPLMLAMTSKGPAMTPALLTTDPDKDYVISKSAIVMKGHTIKEIADQYTYQTTGIQPVSAGSIITG